MYDRPKGGEQAILVHIKFPARHYQEDHLEFIELVKGAGAEAVASVSGAREVPSAKYFVGKGKAQEIRECVCATRAPLVIFNHDLSPSQERNLERLLQCRVVGRTGLILDIFAQRARTFEGKLQVELAQLQHLTTRLVRGWSHLERQRGGLGLRGPGETQLEVDRRLINQRIKNIKKRLDKVRSQRHQSRRARAKAGLPTISLVGYTNAGKSTLFNQLTESQVYTADQLFATLDPTLRRVDLPVIGGVIIADTVGFIRELPHDLIEAFQATLEETKDADLLLHVVDAADESRHALVAHVDDVLAEIGASGVPQLKIYNKIDLLADQKPHIDRDETGQVTRVWLSALEGRGLDVLKDALLSRLGRYVVEDQVTLLPEEGQLRAKLHALNVVVSETDRAEGGWVVRVRMLRRHYQALLSNRSNRGNGHQ